MLVPNVGDKVLIGPGFSTSGQIGTVRSIPNLPNMPYYEVVGIVGYGSLFYTERQLEVVIEYVGSGVNMPKLGPIKKLDCTCSINDLMKAGCGCGHIQKYKPPGPA